MNAEQESWLQSLGVKVSGSWPYKKEWLHSLLNTISQEFDPGTELVLEYRPDADYLALVVPHKKPVQLRFNTAPSERITALFEANYVRALAAHEAARVKVSEWFPNFYNLVLSDTARSELGAAYYEGMQLTLSGMLEDHLKDTSATALMTNELASKYVEFVSLDVLSAWSVRSEKHLKILFMIVAGWVDVCAENLDERLPNGFRHIVAELTRDDFDRILYNRVKKTYETIWNQSRESSEPIAFIDVTAETYELNELLRKQPDPWLRR